ncbi:FAD-dependent oxidoreductase [Streptomyces sp. NPDC059881]|uniref:FAD-dependent oxidoreductase n=1 Tax=Streptomyces sp. NPDC059881 TaxID=3346986 RepID=UPI0036663FD1
MTLSGQSGGSLWVDYDPGPEYPSLTSDIRVDVAVIGAGMAGLCTARELSRSGNMVALLEADRIAYGVSGHTTAKVSALQGLAYSRIRKTRGDDAARQYAESQQDAVAYLRQLAEELGVDCDLEPVTAYTYVTDPDRREELREEADAAQVAGLDARYVEKTPLPFPVSAAVRLDDQAQFHPRKFLLGIAADLTRNGGRIFERTRVTDLKEGVPCRLTTSAGHAIEATDVVVATHYPVFDRGLLFTRLEPKREVVVAGPVPPECLAPEGMFLTDEDNTRSIRTAPHDEGRMLIVTGEKFTPGDPKDQGAAWHFQVLTDWACRHFKDFAVTRRWATQDTFSTDHVPYVGRLHPRGDHTYVATGFGGWGLSGGMMAARLLSSLVTGTPSPWAGLYDPARFHPLAEGPSMLRLGAKTARHLVADRLPGGHADSVDDIGPGQGAVLRSKGEGLQAVHRDASGTLHRLSARCTHLGCIVHFNEAEAAWECPCHGSRFDVNGTVLQGPAVHPLESYNHDQEGEER